eukprot:jgi/Botrbrau1/20776/Bobra.0156s0008.1
MLACSELQPPICQARAAGHAACIPAPVRPHRPPSPGRENLTNVSWTLERPGFGSHTAPGKNTFLQGHNLQAVNPSTPFPGVSQSSAAPQGPPVPLPAQKAVREKKSRVRSTCAGSGMYNGAARAAAVSVLTPSRIPRPPLEPIPHQDYVPTPNNLMQGREPLLPHPPHEHLPKSSSCRVSHADLLHGTPNLGTFPSIAVAAQPQPDTLSSRTISLANATRRPLPNGAPRTCELDVASSSCARGVTPCGSAFTPPAKQTGTPDVAARSALLRPPEREPPTRGQGITFGRAPSPKAAQRCPLDTSLVPSPRQGLAGPLWEGGMAVAERGTAVSGLGMGADCRGGATGTEICARDGTLCAVPGVPLTCREHGTPGQTAAVTYHCGISKNVCITMKPSAYRGIEPGALHTTSPVFAEKLLPGDAFRGVRVHYYGVACPQPEVMECWMNVEPRTRPQERPQLSAPGLRLGGAGKGPRTSALEGRKQRVAKIIAVQWEGFMSKRRAEELAALLSEQAVCFHRQKALRRSWAGLRSNLRQGRGLRERAAVQNMRRQFLRLGACVRAWAAVANEGRHLREVGEALARLHSARLMWRSLLALRTVVLRRARTRMWMMAAEEHVQACLQQKGLKAWRLYLSLKLQKQRDIDQAVLYWAGHLLRLAMESWRRCLAQQQRARSRALALLASARQRLEQHLCCEALRGWRAVRDGNRGKLIRQEAAAHHFLRRLESRVLSRWRVALAERRERRLLASQIRESAQRAVLLRAWATWRGAAVQRRSLQSLQLAKKVKILACLRCWKKWCQERKEKRYRQQIWTLEMARLRARHCLWAWQWLVVEAHSRRSGKAMATGYYVNHVKHEALGAWRAWARQHVAEQRAKRVALGFRVERLLLAGLNAFRQARERGVRKRRAAHVAAHCLLRRLLGGWRRRATYKTARRLQYDAALCYMYAQRLRQGLRGFRREAVRQRKKAEWHDRLAHMHHTFVLRQSLRCWREHTCCRLAAHKHAALHLLWVQENSACRLAWAAWHSYVERRVTMAAMQETAAWHFYRRRLQQLLTGWRSHAAQEGSRTGLLLDALAREAGRFRALRLKQALHVWCHHVDDLQKDRDQAAHTFSRESLSRRALWALQEARAASHCRAAAAARGAARRRLINVHVSWMAWRALATRSRQLRHALQEVLKLRCSILVHVGWRAWAALVLCGRQERLSWSQACSHWKARMESRSLLAWLQHVQRCQQHKDYINSVVRKFHSCFPSWLPNSFLGAQTRASQLFEPLPSPPGNLGIPDTGRYNVVRGGH